MNGTRRTRVLVVDDDVVLADALQQVWEHDDAIEIVGVAHTGTDGIALARRERPDVILMDHHLPDMTGATATAFITATLTGTPIVMLTRDDADETLLAALEAGASGFLLKRSGIREVALAIRRAAADEMLISPSTIARLMAAIRTRQQQAVERDLHREQLSARELEVLSLMGEGLDTRAMANRLGIGQATIRTHASAILAKLGAHSRLEAVAIATRLGVLG